MSRPTSSPASGSARRDPILAIRASDGAVVDAYVSEEDLPRLAPGNPGIFVSDGGVASVAAQVIAIDRTAVRTLAEPELAVPFGGPLAAHVDRQAIVPKAALYRVRLTVALPTAMAALRGEIAGERRSLAVRALRAAAAAVIREWGT